MHKISAIFISRNKMSSLEPELIFENSVINDDNDSKSFFKSDLQEAKLMVPFVDPDTKIKDPDCCLAPSHTQVIGFIWFVTVLENLISQKPVLVFFSGDALSPS